MKLNTTRMLVWSALTFSCVSVLAQHSLDIRYSPSDAPRPFKLAEQNAVNAQAIAESKRLFEDERVGAHVRALIVLGRDGSVLVERYRNGILKNTLHRSMSMAKSITALGFGRAACEKNINLDLAVSMYLPELAGHFHGSATIRHLLTMSTGGPRTNFIGWYSETDEWYYHTLRLSGLDIVKRPVNQDVPHGSRMNYAAYNTIMLGYLVARTTGVSFAEYFQKTVWADINAEYPGGWSRGRDGEARVTGNAFMSLRDYGRLGLYVLDVLDGKKGDECFQKFVRDATKTQIRQTEYPNLYKGYGYQIWTAHPALGKNSFAFMGYLGQRIYVNPDVGLVVVMLVDGPPEAEAVLAGYGNRIFSGFEKAFQKNTLPQ